MHGLERAGKWGENGGGIRLNSGAVEARMRRKMDVTPRFFEPPAGHFFLLGPRGTGKTWWTRQRFPGALRIDLLDPGALRELAARPERLRERVAGEKGVETVVIDEVQKLPELLEVVMVRDVVGEPVAAKRQDGGGHRDRRAARSWCAGGRVWLSRPARSRARAGVGPAAGRAGLSQSWGPDSAPPCFGMESFRARAVTPDAT